jgi:ribonuclease-3
MIPQDVLEARARLFARLEEVIGAGEIPRMAEALTHSSYANESHEPDNQRLEFLGDAVLGLCVSEMLSEAHPTADEGALTRMRSALVNAESLAGWARDIELGACLALGKGARAGNERDQTNVLADAIEALVAAVYQARGLSGARAFVEWLARGPMRESERLETRDPKSMLQETVQARGMPTPSYRVTRTDGPPHAQVFEVEVVVGDTVFGRGQGRSKRSAERAAAIAALKSLPSPDET